MPEKKKSKARRRREQRRRKQRQQRMLFISALGVLAAALIVGAVMILKPAPEDAPIAVPAETAAPEVSATPTMAPTPVPTETPVPTPSPTPTIVPGTRPDVISFYHPESKSYSPRIRMGDEFSAKWKKGEDIGSFEVVASDEDRLEGDFFADMFGARWTSFPDAAGCKIGFELRYTLSDGGEIHYTMLSPEHIEHTEYIECWLYDDYHRKPHQSYSHIKSMKDDTLITSIKLTCGRKIKEVQEIWLTAFICASLDEFDADRSYTGPTSRTLHITRA